jgi:hypothetical protein
MVSKKYPNKKIERRRDMKFVEIGIMLSIFLLFNIFGMNLYADESEANAVKLVRSYFVEALDGKQSDKVYSLFAKDAEQYFNGYLNNVGIEAIYQNTEGAKKIFTTFHTDIHDITVRDKTVYSFITHTATYIDTTIQGFPGGPIQLPTRVGPMLLKGQKVKWQAMARFEFNSNGQIQKEWIVRDELGSLLTSGTVKFINP